MTDIVMITFLTYNNYFYIVVLVGKGTHTQYFIHYITKSACIHMDIES